MTDAHNLILFGGSFDPPHLGHLNTAIAVQQHIGFERFIFLPCKRPVLKPATTASCEQRIQMLRLALAPYNTFEIDQREIQRETPSFMVDTLQSFRDEYGQTLSITLLLGMDAFLQLPQWHDWEKILTLAHLLVINRAPIHEPQTQTIKSLLKQHAIVQKTELFKQSFGNIYLFNAGEYPISSSGLRQKIKSGEDVRPYLPKAVHSFIMRYNLYHH